ncbi:MULTISPECIES: CHAD domain-containing protein [unclassified Lentimonas]|uniref:CHAD domain-containing protein n=2 Tax=Lentimonas TaxID=417293 RepID=UPI001325AE24|nr:MULTISPECIES: CHAD domain-containing protein [unclassified Lentimonas]CAA6678486.1 Adenylate cyclase (EC [Lentimonas sp. CC4]CAA6687481.1 Adenylate cyclase (EC [Lentimonas sp. CC6]CAA7171198.1 Adenylate cyclase (EC [Lentimonas sp. CC21]CAA7183516.1 Adenylate cyclase (EC [Lentimonas sp. CC8]
MSQPLLNNKWQCVEFDPLLLKQTLPLDLTMESSRQATKQVWLYDSFDHSFSRNGRALIRVAGRFSIVNAEDLYTDAISCDEIVRHHRPVFEWDFAEGHFRQVLRSHLKYRAAQQLALTQLEIREFCVRNVDGKIVLRLLTETAKINGVDAVTSITAAPLLGYEAEAASIAKKLTQAPEFIVPHISFAERLLELSGQADVPLSPKDMIRLSPEQSVQSAVTQIASGMVQVARQNEAGIIDDIDSEYLHDYRVALRKLRSVVTLVKGAYSKEDTKQLKDVFGQLARATNRLRDLDVYLLNEAVYREEIPACLSPGLDRLFKDFRLERRRVIRSIQQHFQSPAYLKQIAAQQSWLSAAEQSTGARSTLPIEKVASKEILKHYKLIRKEGMAITPETPDEAVHELRIECKKLRYLLELFASLYGPADLKPILKRLRGLQNVLGDFNDYSVQTESMLEYLNSAKQLDKASAAAVGGLIAVLNDRQRQARSHVTERFLQFSDGKMSERFKRLFTTGKDRK